MFHAPFLSHADKYADFAAYGIDQSEYLDLNNIEPSLFPTSCSYSTGESNACWAGAHRFCRPVSAYALFFRDTQAAIKGRTPNATFGEVSKIVASMWDALDGGAKNVRSILSSGLNILQESEMKTWIWVLPRSSWLQSYKQKTESAKRDYLKRLAAYRASQISQVCIIVLLSDYP
uniref:HMG box domain-containing protein n=1 Tax=Parascaris equorum TaxID=6256 RepID=A0A914RDU1_PAREQ